MENIIYNCPYCNKEFQSKNAWCSHKGKCKQNPNWEEKPRKPRKSVSLTPEHKAKISQGLKKAFQEGRRLPSNSWTGKKHTEEQKKKISESMKKAHAEGRAHNIGECRWNSQPSYPEQWLMKVLKNELSLEKDKDYKMEFPFHRFSLDFAWPERKLCVEIDGEQHERFQEQKLRDQEKDRLLKEEGWREIRKSWKSIFDNSKEFIKELKDFLK